MVLFRYAALLLLLVLGVSQVAAQEDPDALIRFRFNPPLNTPIVIQVESASGLGVGDEVFRKRWSHIIRLELHEHNGDEYIGTFQLTNVTNLENGENDIVFLIARALEGETYAVTLHDLGMAKEVDWPRVEARLRERLLQVASAEMAGVVRAALPLAEDKTRLVLRPIDTIGLAYVLPFRRDGESYERRDLGMLSYFGIENTKMEISGGRDEEDRLVLSWLITAESDAAKKLLADQLQSLARSMDAEVASNAADVLGSGLE